MDRIVSFEVGVHLLVGLAPHRMRGVGNSLERHASFCAVCLGEILKSDRHYGSWRNAHLFVCYAVTNGRWGARASMPNGHDDGLPLVLDLRVQLWIVVGESSGLQPVDRRHVGHVLREPTPDLREEMVGARETIGDEVNHLAITG